MFTMIPYRTSNNAVRYNPFADDFFRSFFGAANAENSFRVDVQDNGNEYLLQAEMPGFDKDSIHVDLDEDLLTISASMDDKHEEKNENGYVIRERRVGSVKRAFNVQGIDKDAISANYTNGVLHLTLPKEHQEKIETKRSIAIN